MRIIFWGLAGLGSIIGGGFLFFGALNPASGAPQEAAGAAIGIAFAVLPYVFARAADEMRKP